MHALAGAGRVIGGRYRLRELIGRGAMGAVWRARDELLDRDVAVKEVQVPPALTERDRDALYHRTLREAKTAARLNHPGVVTVFDVVEEDGRPWIIMELVQARSLDQVLAEDGPLPVGRAADIGHQLVGALATAHAAGVLHRDVKPSNVLLAPDGRAVLTDFGIATFEGDERLTQTGMVMGTPEFTSPERIRGEPATPSSDLWSLGATLFAAVQGRGPYHQRGDAITTMNAVLHEETPAAPGAGQLGPVISALMQKHPAARPDAASASVLLTGALRGAGRAPAAGQGTKAGPGGQGGPGGPGAGAGAASPPTSWDQAVPQPTSWDQAVAPATYWDQAVAPPYWDQAVAPPTSRDQAVAPASSWDQLEQPNSWPTDEPAALRSPGGSVMYGAPVSDAPPYQSDAPAYSPGAVPYPGDAPAYSPGGSVMYDAPVSDAPPYQSDAPAYSPGAMPYPPDAATRAPGPPGALGAASGAPPYSSAGAPSAGAPSYGPPPHFAVAPDGHGPALRRRAGIGRISGRRRRRLLLITGAAVAIVAAGVVAGLAPGHGPRSSPAARTQSRGTASQAATTPASATSPAGATSPGSPATVSLPAGYVWYSLSPASTGTTAGFRLAVPGGWSASTKGLVTYLRNASGTGFMEVDLTPHNLPAAMAEARWLEARTIAQGKFPGYRRISIRPVQVSGSAGAAWTFTWQAPGASRVFAQDYLFDLSTGAGSQSYAVYASGPAASWRATELMLAKAIRTFQPLT